MQKCNGFFVLKYFVVMFFICSLAVLILNINIMKFKSNPYYDPQECGLEILKTIDTAGAYEFDIFAVWKKLDDNTIWYDSDSGCSCPCPFDNRDHGHNLKQVTTENFHGFKEALKNHYNISKIQIKEIETKVKENLNM